MAAAGGAGSAKRFVATRVMPWAVLLFGALFAWVGVEDMRDADASASWPQAGATIIRSSVQRSEGGGGGRPRSVSYAARVAYEFTVAGARHEGSRISYGHYDTADEADAARVVARYPIGSRVTISYMPGNPAESVLEPGTQGLPWLYAALGALFVLVGLALVVAAPRIVAKVA